VKIFRYITIIMLVILSVAGLFVGKVTAMDVTLSWDANTESDLAGYKVYYDLDSGEPYHGTGGTLQNGTPSPSPISMSLNQDENIDPDLVEFTVYNLPGVYIYYFAVKAIDDQGLESDYSNEVNTGERCVRNIRFEL